MLDGVRTGINTVMVATPYLGVTIAALTLSTIPSTARNYPIAAAISGALTAGAVAAGWEFTVNNSDRWEIKTEVILGSAAIGAGGAVIGPMFFG